MTEGIALIFDSAVLQEQFTRKYEYSLHTDIAFPKQQKLHEKLKTTLENTQFRELRKNNRVKLFIMNQVINNYLLSESNSQKQRLSLNTHLALTLILRHMHLCVFLITNNLFPVSI